MARLLLALPQPGLGLMQRYDQRCIGDDADVSVDKGEDDELVSSPALTVSTTTQE